jgi:hypothetical protein
MRWIAAFILNLVTRQQHPAFAPVLSLASLFSESLTLTSGHGMHAIWAIFVPLAQFAQDHDVEVLSASVCASSSLIDSEGTRVLRFSNKS